MSSDYFASNAFFLMVEDNVLFQQTKINKMES